MSKSLKRVRQALIDAGFEPEILEMGETRTAQQAADAANCHVDQIAKSIIFRGETSGEAILFLTAGGNKVCADKASALAGEPLGKADATLIRSQTGFAPPLCGGGAGNAGSGRPPVDPARHRAEPGSIGRGAGGRD